MWAGLLKAFEDGIRHKLDPGEPEERNIYAALVRRRKKVEKLSMSARGGAGRARQGRDDQGALAG